MYITELYKNKIQVEQSFIGKTVIEKTVYGLQNKDSMQVTRLKQLIMVWRRLATSGVHCCIHYRKYTVPLRCPL